VAQLSRLQQQPRACKHPATSSAPIARSAQRPTFARLGTAAEREHLRAALIQRLSLLHEPT
jgi:hypothetical protein